jgi:hypothetical protein
MVWIKTRWNGSFNVQKGSPMDLGQIDECSRCREMKSMIRYVDGTGPYRIRWAGPEGRFTRPKVCWDCLEEGGE